MIRENKVDLNGVIVVNKSIGQSSCNTVQKIKKICKVQKAGHVGTLDPLATGVLPVLIGKATKLSEYLINKNKSYIAYIQLGIETDSGDMTGNVIRINKNNVPKCFNKRVIQYLLNTFLDEIKQVPPIYSAVKYRGCPLYKYARKNLAVIIKPRLINIFAMKCLTYDKKNNILKLYINCTKGTYIRSIAVDLGRKLKCGGTISALHRVSCGIISDKNAMKISEILTLYKNNKKIPIKSIESMFTGEPIVNISYLEKNTLSNYGILKTSTNIQGIARVYYQEIFIAIAIFDKGILMKKVIF